MTIEERIENLKKQKEIAKETYLKCQGAIEILMEMLNQKSKD